MLILAGCGGGRSVDYSLLSKPEKKFLNSERESVLETAHDLLGIPYKWGGETPDGFDCSGYVAYVFREAIGKKLPRLTVDQIEMGKAVSRSHLRPADLVYFWIREKRQFHIGIYIGGGRFIHAPSTNGVVNIQNIDIFYWKSRYQGARRII